MADSNLRSNPVNVEQIMEQIRGRIRDPHGVEYTEQQIQELAAAQLEKFLDPKKVRSNLLDEFRRMRASGFAAEPARQATDDAAVFHTDRAWLRPLRFLLRPIARLFINTKALAAVVLQSESEKSRRTRDQLLFELVHNLVVETARLGIELRNLRMRNESLSGRLEFNERRARALEGAVMYPPSKGELPASDRPSAGSPVITTPLEPAGAPADSRSHQDRTHQHTQAPAVPGDGSGQRRRRRRRRGRRGGGPPPGVTGQAPSPETPPAESSAPAAMHDDSEQAESDDGGSDIEPQ